MIIPDQPGILAYPWSAKFFFDRLILRNHDVKSSRQQKGLEGLRRQIDQWDEELLRVLRSRMAISEAIGDYKKMENITILQTNSWAEILEDRLKKAKSPGLSDQFIIQIFKQVHQESINFQNRVMN
jgi:chorismate mutase